MTREECRKPKEIKFWYIINRGEALRFPESVDEEKEIVLFVSKREAHDFAKKVGLKHYRIEKKEN